MDVKIPLKDLDAALALLAESFPGAFTLQQHLPHRPLKIAIDHDLAMRCPALERRERDAVLRFLYVEACVEGAARSDLDGNVVGAVSAADAGHALAKRAAIVARRVAQLTVIKTARKPAKPVLSPPSTPVPTPAVTPDSTSVSPEFTPVPASPTSEPPKRNGMASLRAAAQRRKAVA